MTEKAPRYLVVVADDFGRSRSINRAVAEGHEKGIVTAASIMAGGEAFEEAAQIARGAGLSVGLHLTLCDGRSVLPPSSIPGLADGKGELTKSPAAAWLRYSRPSLLEQIDREIEAQFAVLLKNGIRPTHVDGHHHLHMQPAVFRTVCRRAAQHGVRWIRIPHERLRLAPRQPGRGAMPFLEWCVFGLLSMPHRREAGKRGLACADRLSGLSTTGRLDEKRLLQMINAQGRVSEIFCHPDTGTPAGRGELLALISPAVRARIASLGITPAGYGTLSGEPGRTGTQLYAVKISSRRL